MSSRFAAGFVTFLLCVGHAHAIKGTAVHEAVDHPEVVLVNSVAPEKQLACSHTGVLIAPTVVLTAAHCVQGFETFEVIAPYAKGRGPQRSAAKAAHVHPGFRPGLVEDDLAILMLKEPLDVGHALPPVHTGNLYPLETKLMVVGRVKNGMISPAQAFESPATLVSFPGNTNLYGGHPQTVEKGDSGGPVFLTGKEKKLVGIVSGILEFQRSNVPTDAYVPLSKHNRDWIQQFTRSR